MGLYNGNLANYYGGLEEFGAYQFISITDVINNFRVAYVGEDKIIPKISRADIKFHAMRGLQELSFDTLKSCKTLELEVPPNLLLPIPHDYVNYIKLTWTDSNGKCHPINACRDCFKDPLSYKQRGADDKQVLAGTASIGSIDVGEAQEGSTESVLVSEGWGEHWKPREGHGGDDPTNPANWAVWHPAVYETISVLGGYSTSPTVESSTTWANVSGSSGQSINVGSGDGSDHDYAMNVGARYGLDGKDANVNGTYWINCRTGKIHFSSNLAGKTVILEYISDHLGTDEEMKVHKFAEEAMYKHIAHAILNVRAGVDRNIVSTFKKERFAAVRSAKLRLSSIKLSEITQILRGKSKWIKH